MDITLSKLKYRNPNRRLLKRGSNFGGIGGVIDPPDGTYVYMAGRFSSKVMNAGTSDKAIRLAPRRRAWGPW
ncbi:MAG: hypothetical protein AB7J46_06755 [Candidatus Altimarinota bacterium]